MNREYKAIKDLMLDGIVDRWKGYKAKSDPADPEFRELSEVDIEALKTKIARSLHP